MANHLPMALIALDRMGATPDRMEEFANRYARRLVRRNIDKHLLDPATSLGVRNNFEGVLAYFEHRISELGAASVLRQWIPSLLPGVAASAFHALIRLAYGIDASDNSEIATGLAYWVIEYQPLGELCTTTREATLAEIAAEAGSAVAGHKFVPGIIIDRMVEVAALPAFQRVSVQPTSLSYEQIADFAIGMYGAREDFIFLHLVTACHAFRTLLSYLEGSPDVDRYLWQAVLVGYLSTGLSCEPLSTVRDEKARTWDDCLAAAIESDDDHVIKLVFTAWQESLRTADPRYLYVARRKLFG
ncbi:MAG TPA: questin oxidase family protein [Steroidobacteraceae bacterium]